MGQRVVGSSMRNVGPIFERILGLGLELYPEGPSAQHFRTLAQKPIKGMVFGTRGPL